MTTTAKKAEKAQKSPTVVVSFGKFDKVGHGQQDSGPVMRLVRSGVPMGDHNPLTLRDYSPRGGTPLRDATAEFIAHLDAIRSPDTVTIGLLADESGSMSGREHGVIGGLNDFVDSMRSDTCSVGSCSCRSGTGAGWLTSRRTCSVRCATSCRLTGPGPTTWTARGTRRFGCRMRRSSSTARSSRSTTTTVAMSSARSGSANASDGAANLRPVSTDVTHLLQGVPDEVVNELAILEDRALRAEQKAAQLGARLEESRAEIDTLRQVIEEHRDQTERLKQSAGLIAERVAELVQDADDMLIRGIAIGAG